MAENWKCTVTDGKHVEPCDNLASFVEGPAAFSRAKGIHVWAYRRRDETGKSVPSRTFYGFKGMGPEGQRKNGMAMNFCPFCGAKIDAPFAEAEEQGEAA